jgi:predicted esterase
VAHGRSDLVLPFAAADRFRKKMEAAGLKVTWVPFEGEHEMPVVVVTALNHFIDGLRIAR